MPTILRVDPRAADQATIAKAAEAIRAGLVVAYPTDTLYGLAVDPRSPTAVRRLFELKGRAGNSPLPLIAADLQQARLAGHISGSGERLAQRWWPGPLTIVVNAAPVIASETLGGGKTVGIRVPDHAVAVALARASGFCITATSANPSGTAAPSTADDVARKLARVDVILDGGASPGGSPSTIVDVSGAAIALLRAGAVPWDRVLESLK
jgi:L-threonylcarbamoyladenylate synthase